MEHEVVSDISKLNDGAFLELIQLELQRIAENILDQNVQPEKVREMNFKLQFKPQLDAQGNVQFVHVIGKCSSKLAANAGVGSIVHVVQQAGKATMYAGNFEQPNLPMKEKIQAVK